MITEFVSVQLSREELQDVHAALVQRAIVEDELRQERGQEPVERRPLLERFEMLLGEGEEVLHQRDHMLDDELWEHAWYVFTDEWARFRAKQDVQKELSADAVGDTVALEKLVELRYRKNFDVYVAELTMDEASRKTAIRSPQDNPDSR